GIEMRPREVASRKVVARYGYVENPASPQQKPSASSLSRRSSRTLFSSAKLYSLDGYGVAEHLMVTIAFRQPFHGLPVLDQLGRDIGQVAGEGDIVPSCSYCFPEAKLYIELSTIKSNVRVVRNQASQPIAKLIGYRRRNPGERMLR